MRLVADGVVPRTERGRYELVPCVHAYIRYLRDRSVGGDLKGGGDVAEAKGRQAA